MKLSPARSLTGTPNALVGMWFALAAIAMLFIGLTSAYVARRGLDPQWTPVSAPPAAVPACAFLIASSLALEYGGRRLRYSATAVRWLLAAWVLALAFIAAQISACRQLFVAGLYLSTSPHSSFFYLFTSLHGLHVLGGMAALTWLICSRAAAARINVLALYWHAMAIIWIYLLAVLFAWT